MVTDEQLKELGLIYSIDPFAGPVWHPPCPYNFMVCPKTNRFIRIPKDGYGGFIEFFNYEELKKLVREEIEYIRIDELALLQKQIVRAGFRYIVDPFLKDIYMSIETYTKPQRDGFMGTYSSTEEFKYFIRFDEGKIKIYHVPSGNREIISTFEDITKFIQEMKKLEDAL